MNARGLSTLAGASPSSPQQKYALTKDGRRRIERVAPKLSEASPLYKAIDAINARYGKGKVFSARHSLTLGVFASPRIANPRKGRLRRGHWRQIVEDEAVEALQTRLDPLG